MNIDLGKFTPIETQALLRECLELLPWEMTAEVLKEVLTLEQIDELTEAQS